MIKRLNLYEALFILLKNRIADTIILIAENPTVKSPIHDIPMLGETIADTIAISKFLYEHSDKKNKEINKFYNYIEESRKTSYAKAEPFIPEAEIRIKQFIEDSDIFDFYIEREETSIYIKDKIQILGLLLKEECANNSEMKLVFEKYKENLKSI